MRIFEKKNDLRKNNHHIALAIDKKNFVGELARPFAGNKSYQAHLKRL
jgi:hypothetical protein